MTLQKSNDESYFQLRERRSYAIRFIKFPDHYRRALHFSRWPSSAASLDLAIPNARVFLGAVGNKLAMQLHADYRDRGATATATP